MTDHSLCAPGAGARLEAEFRTQARAVHGHAELLDYLETLAAHCGPSSSSSDLAAVAAWVFVSSQPAIRPRLRLARIVLFGCRALTAGTSSAPTSSAHTPRSTDQ